MSVVSILRITSEVTAHAEAVATEPEELLKPCSLLPEIPVFNDTCGESTCKFCVLLNE